MSEITHDALVKIAAVWLAQKCRVVATELATATSETPDVIGWNNRGQCIYFFDN